MPLLDIQRQAVEMGRIRLGTSIQRTSKRTGKTYKQPQKLSSFRFTTPSPRSAQAVAGLLGGQVRPWEGQWEVLTDCTELPVSVPPGDAWGSQFYELWKDRVCDRRCDGITEHLRQRPCLCPPAGTERTEAAKTGRACKPTTRINVILPDLPGLGVWRLESHGFYAAVELGGAVELLAQLRAAGQMIPAILRLERRESLRVVGRGTPDEKLEPRDYYVPVLEILTSVREMAALGASGQLADALPPAPSQMRAIASKPSEAVQAPASWSEETPRPAPTATPGGGLPTQPPASPEDLYALAKKATDTHTIARLTTHAEGRGWEHEWVITDPSGDGVAEVLCDALAALGRAMGAGQ